MTPIEIGITNLASDVSPSACAETQRSGSVTGARTGIRIHPPAGSARMIGAEAVSSLAYPALDRRLRGRMLMPAPSSGCASLDPEVSRNAPIGRRPGNPARDETTWRFLHHDFASGRSRRHEATPEVPDRSRHVIPAWSFSKDFRWLDLQSRIGSARSDGLKLPLPTRFDKRARVQFSTIPRFRCGRRWISHRFVAESARATLLRGAG